MIPTQRPPEPDSFLPSNSFYQNPSFDPLQKVADLLTHPTEWADTPDIILYTLKALYDTATQLAMTMTPKTETEKLLGSRASKKELNTLLLTKVNITDVSEAIRDLVSQIDSKVDEQVFDNALSDKVTYDELQFVCEKKLNTEDFEHLLSKFVRIYLLFFRILTLS